MNRQPLRWVGQLEGVHPDSRQAVYDLINIRLGAGGLTPQQHVLASLAIGNYETRGSDGQTMPGQPMELEAAANMRGMKLSRQQVAEVGARLAAIVPAVTRSFAEPQTLLKGDIKDTIGTYLTKPEMHHTYLTKKEEVVLIDSIDAARSVVGDADDLTAEQQRILEAGKTARDSLVLHNLQLAVNIAKRYVGKNRSIDDLIQAANVGLVTAATIVKPGFDAKFTTFAGACIHNALKDHIREDNRGGVRLRNDFYPTDRLTVLETELGAMLGRAPTEYELIEHSGTDDLTVEKVRRYRRNRMLVSPTSYEEYIADMTPPEQIDADQSSHTPWSPTLRPLPPNLTEVAVDELLLVDELDKSLGTLSDREEGVVRMRFGLTEDGEQMTLEEISKVYGVTRERIRQIELKAMSRLSRPIRSGGLKEFLQ